MPTVCVKLATLAAILGGMGVANAGHVSIPVQRFSSGSPLLAHHQGLTRRDTSSYEVDLANQFYYYQATLEIGTPAQTLNLLIDTGSSDLWVATPDSGICEAVNSNVTQNCTMMIFNSSASSTYSSNSSTEFEIAYGDYTYASGLWGQDTIEVGSATIKKGNFALANETNSTSVFGVGPIGGESTAFNLNSEGILYPTYSNIPEQLKEQGEIHTNAYSLYLDSRDSDQGSLLFGGVDKDKYTGDLTVMPMLLYDGNTADNLTMPYLPYVMMNSMGVYNGKNKASEIVSGSMPVLLDSGTTFMVLPETVVETLIDVTSAKYSSDIGSYYCDCSQKSLAGLYFNLMGAEIYVDLGNFLIQINEYTAGTDIDLTPYKKKCMLPLSSSSDTFILGDVFLRSAYVVYDNDHYQVAIANANFDSNSTDIEEIVSSIPNAKTASLYSSTDISSTFTYTTKVSYTSSITGHTAVTTTKSASTKSASASGSASRSASASGSASASASASASGSGKSTSNSTSSASSSSSSTSNAAFKTEMALGGLSLIGLIGALL